MSARYVYDASRPFGQRFVPVPEDWRPRPRPRIAIHGVKQPFRSLADGLYYDDTRTYEREVKARGFEITGNDLKPADFAPPPVSVGDPTFDLLQAASELGTPLG